MKSFKGKADQKYVKNNIFRSDTNELIFEEI